MANWFTKLFSKQPQQEVQEFSEQTLKNAEVLVHFYNENKNLFNEYINNNQDKNEFTQMIYSKLGYSDSSLKEQPNVTNSIQLYRGIHADSENKIKQYTEEFEKGKIFFGANAALFGKGTYMSKQRDVAEKYAKYNANFGSIVSCRLPNTINMIKFDELEKQKEEIVDAIRKNNMSSSEMQQYANILDSNIGVLAAVLGYDAIDIPQKDYILILNRGTMFVENVEYTQSPKLDIISSQTKDIEQNISEMVEVAPINQMNSFNYDLNMNIYDSYKFQEDQSETLEEDLGPVL